jgi:hypothetical protein
VGGRNIRDDFELAQEEAEGANPYCLLVDDYGWSPEEVVTAFSLLDPYSGAAAVGDTHAMEFLADFDLGSDGAHGFADAFDDPDDLEDFLEDVSEGD